MGLVIESAFDFGLIGTCEFYVDSTKIPLSTGPYTHQDFSGSIAHSHGATQFSATLQNLVRFYTSDNNYSVSYSAVNKAYTISHSSSPFVLDFDYGSKGFLAMRVLGFTETQASTTSHTSDTKPLFVLESRWDCPIDWDPDYEQGERFWGGSHNGFIWSGGPPAIPKLYNMRIGYIPYAELFKREATSANPWTWEEFVNYHSGGHYFFVDGSTWYSVDTAHKLQAESTLFKPIEATMGFQREYHLDLKTYIFR